MTVISPRLNVPQAKFLDLRNKFKAYVAGYGAGKTWAGCASLAKHFYEFPRVNAAYFAPTYPQIRDIFYPTVEETLLDWGLTTKVRVGNHEVDVYRGRVYMGTVLCRSMEDPGSIVGFKVGKALVDEIDVMTKDKAAAVWRKILARMRHKAEGLQNGIDVTTTPEGFRFVYEQFVRLPRANESLRDTYGLVQASTCDNEINLPADYIPSLLQSYPANLIDAYIDGKFVNLQTGTVYSAYSRVENRCADTLREGETIFVGMDFNVGKMAAIVHVKRDNLPRAVDEIVNAYDTPDMIRRIKERFWKFDGGNFQATRQIRVYPDASGGSRRSVNASETDLALLKQAGFVVSAPAANPPVKDRVNAMNGMFLNAAGDRRYLVNDSLCPTYADALEQQAWAPNGEPDKNNGHDHPADAGGYFIHQEYPLVRRVTRSQEFLL
ncbi:MAG: terminase [Desulfovibrionaceae bacterium]|nr:terminase [Desulfovibrionaceae bacterium]MBF0514836.1 terminase [Desulfovibrionaceae bacterium]